MSLPKLSTPTHEVIIPSSKQKITLRPFLVKEEKILLMAMQNQEADDMIRATKQVVNNCILTKGISVEDLELYDLEYLILQLRIFSQGETSKIKFAPLNNTTCPECSKERVVEIDLKKAEIKQTEGHNKKIKLTETVGLLMKYPTTKDLGLIEQAKNTNSVEELFKVIWNCIDCIYDQEKVYKASDTKMEEGIEFLESLKSEQFAEIDRFFATMPKLKHTVNVKCGLCDFQQDFDIVGLENFFV